MKSCSRTGQFLLLGILFLVACGRGSDHPSSVTRVSPLGKPPANSIIWSPTNDSEILVTAAYLEPGPASVYILNIVTSKRYTLMQTERGHIWAQNWLPGGQYVTASVSPGTTGYDDSAYWKIDLRSNGREPIGAIEASSVWSPDGKRAVYSNLQAPDPLQPKAEIHLTELDSNQDELIYSEMGRKSFFEPSWSPGSDKFVFSLGENTSSDLKVFEIGTRTVRQLTIGGTNISPVWSPTQNLIAYISVSVDGLKYRIHFVRPDGDCDTQVEGIDDAGSLTWSPDGERLGFIGRDGIYYIEVDRAIGGRGYDDLCP